MRQLPGQVQRLVSRYLPIVDAALSSLIEGLYVVGSTACAISSPRSATSTSSPCHGSR